MYDHAYDTYKLVQVNEDYSLSVIIKVWFIQVLPATCLLKCGYFLKSSYLL